MASILRLLPASRLAAVPKPQLWRAGARRNFCVQSSLFAKKYTKTHEWIEVDDGGKFATIGITEYAAKALGDVVYVEMPEVGTEVSGTDVEVGAVESVKSASSIYSPVTGTVVETNPKLEDTPSFINKSPEGDAWLAKLEITEPAQLDELLTKEDYDAHTQSEDSH